VKFNFDDYLNVVKLNIKNKKLREPICEELESHLQEAANFYSEIGYDDSMAKYKALEDMGPPHYVAEDLAKLHELSIGQIFTQAVYTVLMVAAIGLTLAGSLFSKFIVDYTHSDDFVFMIVPVLIGFIMSVKHKRVLPARMAIILAVASFGSLIDFWNMALVRIFGMWVEYRTMMELDMYGQTQSGLIKLGSIVLTVVVIGLLAFVYERISTYVLTPSAASVEFKRMFEICVIPVLCVILIGFAATKMYMHRADVKEKEEWNKVVAEFCDYCLENEKITAEKVDDVIAHFDYLEFIEYEHTDDPCCKKHFSAAIGDKSIAFPHFYICVMEDGTVEIEVVAYMLNSVWEQEEKGYSFGNNPLESLNEGADITEFTDVVKEEELQFFYKYKADSDEVTYSTTFKAGESAFDAFIFYVTVDSGIITNTYYDDFP
jgi:hypothetical protein